MHKQKPNIWIIGVLTKEEIENKTGNIWSINSYEILKTDGRYQIKNSKTQMNSNQDEWESNLKMLKHIEVIS